MPEITGTVAGGSEDDGQGFISADKCAGDCGRADRHTGVYGSSRSQGAGGLVLLAHANDAYRTFPAAVEKAICSSSRQFIAKYRKPRSGWVPHIEAVRTRKLLYESSTRVPVNNQQAQGDMPPGELVAIHNRRKISPPVSPSSEGGRKPTILRPCPHLRLHSTCRQHAAVPELILKG